ncbi:MAG: hypothetical protein SVM86_02250, partial [Candidatus Cloacimonadota bacterium]|nr:hypothetical protein [Candidatus Cloacimonadota bacterium]
MADLIVMLTKDDETVPNAKTLFEKIRHLPFHGIGFKDVGIGWPEMKDLAAAIKQTDKKFYFEIVSEGVMKNSVQKALNLKADVIMGGNYDETISKAKKKAEYYPYVGKFSERPCQLYGKIEEIVKETKMIANKNIEGITLLAYRHSCPEKLLGSICQQIDTKLIVAGSVDSK